MAKTEEEIDHIMKTDPRSLTYEDMSPEMVEQAKERFAHIACTILAVPRERLKSVEVFGATELGNKTGIVFNFDPELTKEETKLLEAGFEIVNRAAGGRPLIKPGKT